MTWIDEIRKNVKKKYKISPYISENYTVRYKKFYHRATLRLVNQSEQLWNPNQDMVPLGTLVKELRKSLGNGVKLRNNWCEIFIYFNDLDHLLDSIPKRHIKKLCNLEIMDPNAITATKEFSHEYPVELVIRNKLPFDKYRYRVYTVSSYTEKARKIGKQNLKALQDALTVYDGIRWPRQQYSFFTSYNPVADYFYAETLDFLQMIYLMEPRYIRTIQQFKTTKELNEHDSTS